MSDPTPIELLMSDPTPMELLMCSIVFCLFIWILVAIARVVASIFIKDSSNKAIIILNKLLTFNW